MRLQHRVDGSVVLHCLSVCVFVRLVWMVLGGVWTFSADCVLRTPCHLMCANLTLVQGDTAPHLMSLCLALFVLHACILTVGCCCCCCVCCRMLVAISENPSGAHAQHNVPHTPTHLHVTHSPTCCVERAPPGASQRQIRQLAHHKFTAALEEEMGKESAKYAATALSTPRSPGTSQLWHLPE